jgi:hypothetical protein
VVILGNCNFVQTSKNVELFTNLFTGRNNPNNSQWAFLAILRAKGCELVLRRLFAYLMEIFSSSIQVTISIKP